MRTSGRDKGGVAGVETLHQTVVICQLADAGENTDPLVLVLRAPFVLWRCLTGGDDVLDTNAVVGQKNPLQLLVRKSGWDREYVHWNNLPFLFMYLIVLYRMIAEKGILLCHCHEKTALPVRTVRRPVR